MQTNSIATWNEANYDDSWSYDNHGIATETQPPEDPLWQQCLDAMLRLWESHHHGVGESRDDARPNRSVIESALKWLVVWKRDLPDQPPTLIIREPGGGLIIERRELAGTDNEFVFELTLYNTHEAEITYYSRGRVVDMHDIPFFPLQEVKFSRRSV